MSSVDCVEADSSWGYELPDSPLASFDGESKEYEIVPTIKFFQKEFTVLLKHFPTWTITTNLYARSFFQFFDWRKSYTIQDANHNVVAYAIKDYGFSLNGLLNLSFLGLFYPHSLSDFNVYDKDGKFIGHIDGKVLDLSPARFDFSDAAGNTVAYARQEGVQVTVRDYQTDNVLAYMGRQFEDGRMDCWSVHCTSEIDPRLLFIFSAYVVEHQAHFMEDT